MYKDKKIIAIIPARSGSKSLPDKNIKELMGKPLIAWAIDCAICANVFDRIIVSTDSEKYAQIAKKYGAEVPFLRSKENSTDEASSWSVCEEVLNRLAEKYDIVVMLQPTTPLRLPADIEEALNLFFTKNADSVVSVTKMSHPVEWCNSLPDDLSLYNFVKPENNKLRQDLAQSYTLNGAIYIVKSNLVGSKINVYNKNSYAYIMDGINSIDIDSELDFLIAQALMPAMLEREHIVSKSISIG